MTFYIKKLLPEFLMSIFFFDRRKKWTEYFLEDKNDYYQNSKRNFPHA